MKIILYLLGIIVIAGIVLGNAPIDVPTEPKLGGLAPLPGSITEGTSTAGWTDDGSIVRLNTQADNVGIGTVNPSQKLQVQGSAYITNNLSISGGSIDFSNGPSTTTITKVTNGNLGFGTSTPSAEYSFGGGIMAPGTTTFSTVMFASSTFGVLGRKYTWPAADGTVNQALITNGQGVFSFASVTSLPANTSASSSLANDGSGNLIWSTESGWQKLKELTADVATGTMGIIQLPVRSEYEIIINIVSVASAGIPRIRFNLDAGTTYGYTVVEDSVRCGNGGSGCASTDNQLILAGTSTTSPAYYKIYIHNEATLRKLVKFEGNSSPSAAIAPINYNGSGVWNNTADSIRDFQLITGGGNFGAGTKIKIYGKN